MYSTITTSKHSSSIGSLSQNLYVIKELVKYKQIKVHILLMLFVSIMFFEVCPNQFHLFVMHAESICWIKNMSEGNEMLWNSVL